MYICYNMFIKLFNKVLHILLNTILIKYNCFIRILQTIKKVSTIIEKYILKSFIYYKKKIKNNYYYI